MRRPTTTRRSRRAIPERASPAASSATSRVRTLRAAWCRCRSTQSVGRPAAVAVRLRLRRFPRLPDPAAAPRRRIAAIVNAGSGAGHGDAIVGLLQESFARFGAHVDVRVVHDEASIAKALDDARAAKADAIVAGGGDGTVSRVAGDLAGTGLAFGVLPLGTLNHFAKDLGVPLELEDAVGTIVH